MICKKCGAYNPDHATFCKVCAANLKEQPDVDEAKVSDAEEARRNALAEQLRRQTAKKSKLIDPLELFSILDDIGLADYEPVFKWESDEATQRQIQALNNYGIDADGMTKGYACAILDKIIGRSSKGLATVKQVKLLRNHGYDPIDWTFEQASAKIGALAKVGWKRWKLYD